MSDELVLTASWTDLRSGGPHEDDQREKLHNELTRELSPGHPLHGQSLTIVGRSDLCDDLLVTPARGGWAIVHLTWKRAPDTPPWPITDFYDNVESLTEALQADEVDSPAMSGPSAPLRGRPWLANDRTGGPLDGLLDRLRQARPYLIVERLEATHAADDDNVYFIGNDHGLDLVQLDTGSDGQPPFLIEAAERHTTSDPVEAAAVILAWLRSTDS